MKQFGREIAIAMVAGGLLLALGVLTVLTLKAKRSSRLYRSKVWVMGALVGMTGLAVGGCDLPSEGEGSTATCYGAPYEDVTDQDTTTPDDDMMVMCYAEQAPDVIEPTDTDQPDDDTAVMCYGAPLPDVQEPTDTSEPEDDMAVMCYAAPAPDIQEPADTEEVDADDPGTEEIIMCYAAPAPDIQEPADTHAS